MGMNLTYDFKAICAVTTPKCLSLVLTFPMDPNPISSFHPSLHLDRGAGLGTFQVPHLLLSQASPCQTVTTQALQVLRPKTQASRFLSQPSSNLSENLTGLTFHIQYSPPSLLPLAPATCPPPGWMRTPPNGALISVVCLLVLVSHRGQRGPITAHAPEQAASPLKPSGGPHLWGLGDGRRT